MISYMWPIIKDMEMTVAKSKLTLVIHPACMPETQTSAVHFDLSEANCFTSLEITVGINKPLVTLLDRPHEHEVELMC